MNILKRVKFFWLNRDVFIPFIILFICFLFIFGFKSFIENTLMYLLHQPIVLIQAQQWQLVATSATFIYGFYYFGNQIFTDEYQKLIDNRSKKGIFFYVCNTFAIIIFIINTYFVLINRYIHWQPFIIALACLLFFISNFLLRGFAKEIA